MAGVLSPPRWRTRGFRGYQEPGLQKQSRRPHVRRRRRRKESTCRKAGGRRVCDRPPPSPGCPPRTAPARRGARPASARCHCRRSRRSRSAARSRGSSGDEDPSSKPVGRPPPPTTIPLIFKPVAGGVHAPHYGWGDDPLSSHLTSLRTASSRLSARSPRCRRWRFS